jgi:hypothetical protein
LQLKRSQSLVRVVATVLGNFAEVTNGSFRAAFYTA